MAESRRETVRGDHCLGSGHGETWMQCRLCGRSYEIQSAVADKQTGDRFCPWCNGYGAEEIKKPENLCDTCVRVRCPMQSGIRRTICDLYLPQNNPKNLFYQQLEEQSAGDPAQKQNGNASSCGMTRLEYIRQMHDGTLIGYIHSLISDCKKCPAFEFCRHEDRIGGRCEDVLAKYFKEAGGV